MLIMTVLEKRSVCARPKAVIKLTRMESALYGVLWERRGQIVSSSDLLDVMDAMNELTNERTTHTAHDLRVYICRMRRKLKNEADIGTYPKKGYSLSA